MEVNMYEEIEKEWKNIWKIVVLIIYTKIKRKESKTYKFLTSLVFIYLGSVATTYLVFEGDQAWRIGSFPFPIYTMNERAS